jgi:hypothetical protein
MNLKTLIIHDHKVLFNILNEIKEFLNFKIIDFSNKDANVENNENYLILTKNKNLNYKNSLLLDNNPIRIKELFEIVNIKFLKISYNIQSSISVGQYKLDLNSRSLSINEIILNLTEMEAKLIIYLKNSNQATDIKELQKNVWGQTADLETHTVETHIYRLRKKIKNQFNDDNFIMSTKNGYKIS